MSAARREPEPEIETAVGEPKPESSREREPETAAGEPQLESSRARQSSPATRHHRRESLDQRINRLEERIGGHRDALALRTQSVGGGARKLLSSPFLIVAAAGAGFVVAQFRKRRRRPEREETLEPVVVKPSIFASLTDALTLATTLLAMMPLIRKKAEQGAQDAQQGAPES